MNLLELAGNNPICEVDLLGLENVGGYQIDDVTWTTMPDWSATGWSGEWEELGSFQIGDLQMSGGLMRWRTKERTAKGVGWTRGTKDDAYAENSLTEYWWDETGCGCTMRPWLRYNDIKRDLARTDTFIRWQGRSDFADNVWAMINIVGAVTDFAGAFGKKPIKELTKAILQSKIPYADWKKLQQTQYGGGWEDLGESDLRGAVTVEGTPSGMFVHLLAGKNTAATGLSLKSLSKQECDKKTTESAKSRSEWFKQFAGMYSVEQSK